MKTYIITYRECGETIQWACKAYDKCHAVEKFIDPEAGFSIDMIEKVEKFKPNPKRLS